MVSFEMSDRREDLVEKFQVADEAGNTYNVNRFVEPVDVVDGFGLETKLTLTPPEFVQTSNAADFFRFSGP